jgi:hypothetical protein
MPNLYALLVAIDTYPEGIRSLAGCVNDADSIQDLLQTRFGQHDLHLQRINNRDATREAVIRSFRSHLGQATKDDIALFFYAGHGSQVQTGGLFKEIEPDGLNESIVCYDSRLPGGLDLVDKDIATLITDLTRKGVHVTTIFDSCHSGSITRDLDDLSANSDNTAWERRIERREDAQPLDAYLSKPAELEAAVRDIATPPPGAGSLTLATAAFQPDDSGMYVLLAACEDNQTAKEYIDTKGDRKRHGAFTYFLTQTLKNAVQPLSYRDIIQLVSSAMQDPIPGQTPKLECAGGDRLFHNLFLGLTPAPYTDYAIARFSQASDRWQLDRGALLRVALNDRFTLYPMSAEAADFADPTKAVGAATVASLLPATAFLKFDAGVQLDQAIAYKAVGASCSAAIPVSFDGDEGGVALLNARAASGSHNFRVGPDPRLRSGPEPRFRVVAKDGSFTVTTSDGNRVLYGPAPQDEPGADSVIAALDHMSLWKMRLELKNPASMLPANKVEFAITLNPGTDSENKLPSPPPAEITLAYMPDAMGNPQKPTYTARVKNNFTQDLYITMLVFSDDWSISSKLTGAGAQRLAPGEEFYANQGKPVRCVVPSSATESIDEVLLVVSTDSFQGTAFCLSPLMPYGAAERGMDTEDEDEPIHDFFTRRVTFHTTRPAS